jgi:hypothetical protein
MRVSRAGMHIYMHGIVLYIVTIKVRYVNILSAAFYAVFQRICQV